MKKKVPGYFSAESRHTTDGRARATADHHDPTPHDPAGHQSLKHVSPVQLESGNLPHL